MSNYQSQRNIRQEIIEKYPSHNSAREAIAQARQVYHDSRVLYQEVGFPCKPDTLDDTLTDIVVEALQDEFGPNHNYDIRGISIPVVKREPEEKEKSLSDKPYLFLFFGEANVSLKGYEDYLRERVLGYLEQQGYETGLDGNLSDIDIAFNIIGQNGILEKIKDNGGEAKAGDMTGGIGVAYRNNGTDDPCFRYLPPQFWIATHLANYLNSCRLSGELEEALPDGKIAVLYNVVNFIPNGLLAVDVACQHQGNVTTIRQNVSDLIRDEARRLGIPIKGYIIVNNSNGFNEGLIDSDGGISGNKTHTQFPGDEGIRIDSFPGEGFSKPGILLTIGLTYLARHVVAAGLADYARIGGKIVINQERITHLDLETRHSCIAPEDKVIEALEQVWEPTLENIIGTFDLENPQTFQDYVEHGWYWQGHPWMQIDETLVEELLANI
ncbi:hypothetical protein JXB41_08920 [Candidatus Woesearchaeota archaeon]|nr:hypothetical protein [Candidatus Woesearchaeota archaeon]